MGKIRFFSKQDTGKPQNDVPDNNDADVEKPEAENEEIFEEMTGTDSEMSDAPMSEENTDLPESEENVESEEMTEAGAGESDDELVALQNKLEELQDKYLRLAAEYDNYRKRTLREKTELIQTAGESLLKDILPLVDDFDRGIEVASNAEDMDSVRTGIGLIYSKLKEFLTNNGIKEIDAMNEPFDTDWHEAVINIKAPSDDMKGLILDVIQKGYTLNNKVIRYPKVVVGE